MLFVIVLSFLLFCLPPVVIASDVVINEFQLQPVQWVELYNTASVAADVSGFIIDDDGRSSGKFVIPSATVLSPFSFAVFESNSFSLNTSSPDTIRLLQGTTLIDSYTYEKSPGDAKSFGRSVDGRGEWVVFETLTRNSTNSAGIIRIDPTPTLTPLPTPTLTPNPTKVPTVKHESLLSASPFITPTIVFLSPSAGMKRPTSVQISMTNLHTQKTVLGNQVTPTKYITPAPKLSAKSDRTGSLFFVIGGICFLACGIVVYYNKNHGQV